MSRLIELINLAAQDVRFGKLSLNLDVHDQQVRAIEGSEQSKRIYPGDGTSKALEEQALIINQLRQNKSSGLITFSFEMKAGVTKKMYIYRQIKHLLTGE